MSENVIRMIRCASPVQALYVSPSRMVIAPLKVPFALRVLSGLLAIGYPILLFLNAWSPLFYVYAGVGLVLFLPALGFQLYVRSSWKKAEENMKLPPDKLLEEDKRNYQILNSEVTTIVITKGTAWKNPMIAVSNREGKHIFVVHARETKTQDSTIEDFRRLFDGRLILASKIDTPVESAVERPLKHEEKIELLCPTCGKLFKGESEMLEHYSREHEKTENKE